MGFLLISCTFHMVGGLLPADKTSSGNKDENPELSIENSLSEHLSKLICDSKLSGKIVQIMYSVLKNEHVSHSKLKNFL